MLVAAIVIPPLTRLIVGEVNQPTTVLPTPIGKAAPLLLALVIEEVVEVDL
jgi:hypothetical protein